MKLIIICFRYSDELILPSSYHDLYSLLPLIQKCGLDDTMLITDIVNCYELADAIDCLFDLYHDKEMCDFFLKLVLKFQHKIIIPSEAFPLNSIHKESFIESINSINDSEIMLFYSGHIYKTSIILPNREKIEIGDVNLTKVKKYVSIIDACCAENFKVISSLKQETIQFFSCFKDEITLSSMFDESFTRKIIKKIIRDFPVVYRPIIDTDNTKRNLIYSNCEKITFCKRDEYKD